MPDNNGSYLPSIRWNSEEETDQLVYVETNEVFEQERSPIPLNSSASTFVMDVLRREHGRGRIATGTYKMQLVPVGQEVPPIPEDEAAFAKDYKPAIGVWVWNPPLGEVRIETNGTMFRNAVAGILDQTKNCKEAGDGLVPVAQFTDRHKQDFRQLGKSFWGPIIVLCGWLPRAQIAPFAAREPTVPRLAAPAQSQ